LLSLPSYQLHFSVIKECQPPKSDVFYHYRIIINEHHHG
jgi:hypothetical protein